MDEKKTMPGSERTRGTGDDSSRNRSSDSDRSSGSGSSSSSDSSNRERSSGISNRSMDEEISEQEELPERGSRQSER